MIGAGAIAIGVPVRNEVERLPRLLHRLAQQRDVSAFTLCLFFDGCDDGSMDLAGELAAALPYPIRSACCRRAGPPNAGRARARAMADALAAAPHGVLLTTDADSAPSTDWIAANLAGLASADIVAGRIVRDYGPASPTQDRVEGYYDRLHALRRGIDPVAWEASPTHHWTSAASLAMRSATYRALGGFAPVAAGEDAAFCDGAARSGHRIRRDAGVVVRTSARRRGRAEQGFAAALAALDAGAQPLMHHPEDEAWRFALHADARLHHGSRDYRDLAIRLGLPAAEVEQVARECRNGEAFAARIVGEPPGGMRMVSLAHAEALLATLEQLELEGAA